MHCVPTSIQGIGKWILDIMIAIQREIILKTKAVFSVLLQAHQEQLRWYLLKNMYWTMDWWY